MMHLAIIPVISSYMILRIGQGYFNILDQGMMKFIMTLYRLCIVLLLVDRFVGVMLLPSQIMPHLSPSQLHLMEGNGWKNHLIDVSQFDSSHSLQISVLEPENSKSPFHDKTVLFLCPNGVQYEQISGYLEEYAARLGLKRIVAFNYRGVGSSYGVVGRSQDLVDDAVTVIKFLEKEYNLDSNQLIAHGWSLGGGIALMLRDFYPDLMIVHDRSFLTLSKAASVVVSKNAALSFGLGVIATLAVHWIAHGNFPGISIITIGVWLFVGVTSLFYLKSMVPFIIQSFGWEMSVEHEKISMPMLVVYHKLDGMIEYETASLHYALGDQVETRTLELQTNLESPMAHHMYFYLYNTSEWDAFEDQMTQIIQQRDNHEF